MRREVFVACLVVLIGSAASQELLGEPLSSTETNGTIENGPPRPGVVDPSNGTDLAGNNTEDGSGEFVPEETSTESTASQTVKIVTTKNPAAAETTSPEGPTTKPEVPTSVATAPQELPTPRVSTPAGRTRYNRTQRPRTTTTTRGRRPRKNKGYGTLIDSNGCVHKVLQQHKKLYTSSCTAKCGKQTHHIKDGSPCLIVEDKNGRYKKSGVPCFKGECDHGRCYQHFIPPKNCKIPQGTIIYQDYYDDYYNYDYGYYYDDYYGNSIYEHRGRKNKNNNLAE